MTADELNGITSLLLKECNEGKMANDRVFRRELRAGPGTVRVSLPSDYRRHQPAP